MAGFAADSYSIARPTGLCALTGEPIGPGSQFVATLIERAEEEGLDRIDYSISAWESGARPERLFGFWRSVMPDSEEKSQPLIDDEDLLSLFDQLEDATDDRRIGFRFLLALILTRKRLLRHVGSRTQGGRRVMLVRRRGSDRDDKPEEVLEPEENTEAIAVNAEEFIRSIRGDA